MRGAVPVRQQDLGRTGVGVEAQGRTEPDRPGHLRGPAVAEHRVGRVLGVVRHPGERRQPASWVTEDVIGPHRVTRGDVVHHRATRAGVLARVGVEALQTELIRGRVLDRDVLLHLPRRQGRDTRLGQRDGLGLPRSAVARGRVQATGRGGGLRGVLARGLRVLLGLLGLRRTGGVDDLPRQGEVLPLVAALQRRSGDRDRQVLHLTRDHRLRQRRGDGLPDLDAVRRGPRRPHLLPADRPGGLRGVRQRQVHRCGRARRHPRRDVRDIERGLRRGIQVLHHQAGPRPLQPAVGARLTGVEDRPVLDQVLVAHLHDQTPVQAGIVHPVLHTAGNVHPPPGGALARVGDGVQDVGVDPPAARPRRTTDPRRVPRGRGLVEVGQLPVHVVDPVRARVVGLGRGLPHLQVGAHDCRTRGHLPGAVVPLRDRARDSVAHRSVTDQVPVLRDIPPPGRRILQHLVQVHVRLSGRQRRVTRSGHDLGGTARLGQPHDLRRGRHELPIGPLDRHLVVVQLTGLRDIVGRRRGRGRVRERRRARLQRRDQRRLIQVERLPDTAVHLVLDQIITARARRVLILRPGQLRTGGMDRVRDIHDDTRVAVRHRQTRHVPRLTAKRILTGLIPRAAQRAITRLVRGTDHEPVVRQRALHPRVDRLGHVVLVPLPRRRGLPRRQPAMHHPDRVREDRPSADRSTVRDLDLAVTRPGSHRVLRQHRPLTITARTHVDRIRPGVPVPQRQVHRHVPRLVRRRDIVHPRLPQPRHRQVRLHGEHVLAAVAVAVGELVVVAVRMLRQRRIPACGPVTGERHVPVRVVERALIPRDATLQPIRGHGVPRRRGRGPRPSDLAHLQRHG